jgi:plastocyanin
MKIQDINYDPLKMKLKVGDTVRYFEILNDNSFTDHTVTGLLPEGIPSCREGMVRLSDKRGYVLESHCKSEGK